MTDSLLPENLREQPKGSTTSIYFVKNSCTFVPFSCCIHVCFYMEVFSNYQERTTPPTGSEEDLQWFSVSAHRAELWKANGTQQVPHAGCFPSLPGVILCFENPNSNKCVVTDSKFSLLSLIYSKTFRDSKFTEEGIVLHLQVPSGRHS